MRERRDQPAGVLREIEEERARAVMLRARDARYKIRTKYERARRKEQDHGFCRSPFLGARWRLWCGEVHECAWPLPWYGVIAGRLVVEGIVLRVEVSHLALAVGVSLDMLETTGRRNVGGRKQRNKGSDSL